MAYRCLIFILGLLLFVYAIIFLYINSLVGFTHLIPALYLLLLSNSYPVPLFTDRLGAWVGTLGRHEQ